VRPHNAGVGARPRKGRDLGIFDLQQKALAHARATDDCEIVRRNMRVADVDGLKPFDLVVLTDPLNVSLLL
jgi:hypothetical protein